MTKRPRARFSRPSLSAAASMIAAIDSRFASSTKAHVLTISTSALSGSATTRIPWRCRSPSITSASTVFFGQPSATRWTVACGGGAERVVFVTTALRGAGAEPRTARAKTTRSINIA